MKYVLILMTMIFGIGLANAEEAQGTAKAGPRVVLTSIKHDTGMDVSVSPTDYPNGVFVRVKETFGERPVSAKIFAGKLHSRGFKIAETAESADLILTVRGNIDFKEIDQDSDSTISGNKMDAATGIVITAVVTGGLSLLSSDYSDLTNSKPVYQRLTVFVQPNKQGTEELTTIASGAIKTDARNAKVTRAFFELMADEWLKQHVKTHPSAEDRQPAIATITKP